MPIQANDFLSNSLSGAAVVIDQKISISLPTVKIPLEGDKTFVVKIRQSSVAGEVLAESPTITLKDYSEILSVIEDKQIMAEGDTVQFTINTANIDNFSNIYYTTTGNVDFNDFVEGNVGIITIIDNVGYANLTANLDLNTFAEGDEQFSLQFRGESISGPVSATSSNVVIIRDTSNVVSITGLSISSNVILESESVTFNINTVNSSGANSTTLFYTITGNADIYSGQYGSFLVSGNQANLQLIAETSVPQGEERNFTVEFRRNSISGPVLLSSENIKVKHFGGERPANILYGNSTIIYDEVNNYLTAVYRTSSNINVISASPLSEYNTIDYLAIAGGGGGGSNAGAGGGAGGLLTGRFTLNSSNTGVYAVVVGAGGTTGDSAKGTPGTGSNLNIIGIFTRGGGGGGHGASTPGLPGGSGGGSTNPGTAGANVILQGNPGGTGGTAAQGGGGGAGAAGAPGAPSPVSGRGGIGLAIPWMPVGYGTDLNNAAPPTTLPRYFAGGGGGSAPTTILGGAGGGGNGGNNDDGTATAGRAFTGGGGGGVGQNFRVGRAGGSGIVAIRQLYSNLWLTYPENVSSLISIVKSVEANTTIINGGSSILFTINTIAATEGEILYFNTVGNVDVNTFMGGNTGSFVVSGNTGTVLLTPNGQSVSKMFALNVTRQLNGVILKSSSNVIINEAFFSTATGGTIYTSGEYTYHKFTSSANLTLSPSPSTYMFEAEALVIAGGGGGGGTGGWGGGGGGGAGGVVFGPLDNLISYNVPLVISIGAGGARQLNAVGDGNIGSNTTVTSSGGLSLIAYGGGGGGRERPGVSGGSGGGGGGGDKPGGTATQPTLGVTNNPPAFTNYGNAGGYATPGGLNNYRGAGGGGSGAAGADSPASDGGNGGIGTDAFSTWASATSSGVSGRYAGGGGGAARTITPTTNGTGGAGGGGNAGTPIGGDDGVVNTGGGGGAWWNAPPSPTVGGGGGGSGIVIIRYKSRTN